MSGTTLAGIVTLAAVIVILTLLAERAERKLEQMRKVSERLMGRTED